MKRRPAKRWWWVMLKVGQHGGGTFPWVEYVTARGEAKARRKARRKALREWDRVVADGAGLLEVGLMREWRR